MSESTPKKHYAGVAFRATSGAIFIDMGAAFKSNSKPASATVPDETMLSALPWSPWGDDNLLPKQYVDDILKCGVLNAIIDGKARFALCQGLKPAIIKTDPATGAQVIEKYVDDPEILEFLDNNNCFEQAYAWMKDLTGFSWAICRYMLNNAGTAITGFKRDDLTEARFSRKDKRTKRSTHIWYSADFDKVRTPNDQRVFKVVLLQEQNTLQDLQALAASGVREFAHVYRNPGWGVHYYPVPLWMAAYKWVKIAQSVPEMKASLFENSMRPKYKVIIMEDYWENRYGDDWQEWDEDDREKKKQAFYDEIDAWLVGSKNAHKSIFVNGKLVDDSGKVITDIDIIPIEDTTKPGELLPDSAAANSELAIAMLWNNAMTGGNQKAGQYAGNEGGSNVREATLLQTIIHEVERYVVKRFMQPIIKFNGWDKKHPGLQFVIPATVMTTLDTGGGTKPIVTGGAEQKEKSKPDDTE